MPRTPEQYEKMREMRMKAIQDAALTCFANYGYHGTSMATIAREAGVSTGLAYNYFKSKEELMVSLLISGMQRISHALTDTEILDKSNIKQFLEDSFDDLQKNVGFWKLYLQIVLHPTMVVDSFTEFMKLMEKIQFATYQYFEKSGVKRPDVETALFFSTIDGIFMDYMMDLEHYPLDAIKQKVYKMYDL